MTKPELGTKRNCPKCASRFYDLKKNPAECPICGHGFDPEAPVKKRGKRKTVKMHADDVKTKVIAAQAAGKKNLEDGDEDDIELPEFEDLGIIEDIDDLDDMNEVDVVKKNSNDDEDADDKSFIDDSELLAEVEIDEDEEDDDRR